MIHISNFSSLSFKEYRNYFEEEKGYIQCFSKDDRIIVCLTYDENFAYCVLRNISTGEEKNPTITNAGHTLLFNINSVIDGFGEYEAVIKERIENTYINVASSKFLVLPDECLENTVKISYTSRRNELGVIFIAPSSNKKYVYDIRFHGGIIFRENKYSVEDEMFRDQNYVGQLTSAYPYYSNKLTIGDAEGVPEWVGLKLNAIFSLSTVTINGKSYRRSDGAVPERTELSSFYPLYIWKIDIEPDDFYNDDTEEVEISNVLTDNTGNILTDNFGNILTE